MGMFRIVIADYHVVAEYRAKIFEADSLDAARERARDENWRDPSWEPWAGLSPPLPVPQDPAPPSTICEEYSGESGPDDACHQFVSFYPDDGETPLCGATLSNDYDGTGKPNCPTCDALSSQLPAGQ